MLHASSKLTLQRIAQTKSVGARVILILAALAFVAAFSYEIAVLAYTPKHRPLQFHSSLTVPYIPFLIGWSVVTILCGLALVFHRRLHAVLRRFSLLRRHWGNALLAIVAVVIGVGMVEMALRVVDPMGISTFPKTLRFWDIVMVPDEELRYRMRRNLSTTFHGVAFETNSEGMRDDEPLAVAPGSRIVVFGDSVALGAQVPKNETTFHLLEELLGGRETVDVVNTAVSSYNTVQQRRLLSKIGDRYQPDLVLLLYVENDAQMEHTLPFYGAEYWNQAVYLPRTVAQYSYIRHPLRLGINALSPEPSARQSVPHNQEGWKLSMRAMRRMSEWCEARNIPFLVVFYPMLDPLTGHAYFDLLSQAARQGRFPLIYSAKYWTERRLSDIHHSAVDSHLSPLGHRLLAEGLNRELRQRYPSLIASE